MTLANQSVFEPQQNNTHREALKKSRLGSFAMNGKNTWCYFYGSIIRLF